MYFKIVSLHIQFLMVIVFYFLFVFITFLSVLDRLNDCELTRIIVDSCRCGCKYHEANRFIESTVESFQLNGVYNCNAHAQ